MSKKYSSWTSNQPVSSMKTDLTMMKLISVEGDEQDQSKDRERVETNSPMSNDVDASSSAPAAISLPLIDEQCEVSLGEKSLIDISATSKRNHKHHHHHHHHHHCHRHHHHHHLRHRVKNISKQQQPPTIVNHKVLNNESCSVDKTILTNVSHKINNETTLTDDQQAPLVVSNQDPENKPIKGNIPLQSVENKLVSQRAASTDESQVGNFSSMICAQPSPSFINNYGTQQIEQIIYDDGCCFPSSAINCATNSCILPQCDPCVCLPQYDPFVCLPQQQQPQLFLCTDPNSIQDYICSPSTTIQPTVINQIPVFNSSSTSSSSQYFICVPQTSVQPTANIVIQQQQPQIQSQPVQIIQTPQTQPAQYLQISSAAPQYIQTVQAPTTQNLQPQIIQAQPRIQTIQASPQILYQRPYDPVVIPFQNQQLAVAQSPFVALSQPSYAPPRIIPAAPAQRPLPGPRMFQHALVRSVANQTGIPVLSPSAGGLQLVQPPMVSPSRGAPLASTARALFTDGLKPSPSLPIVPLTAGGLLIPFQPFEPPKGMIRGALPRTVGYPSRLANFDNARQQIQQRAQLLANLQRQNSNQISSLPRRSANAAVPSLPAFSSNLPPRLPPNILRPFSGGSSRIPVSPPGSSPNMPQLPPGVIRSQTPYASGNIFGTSSSSSSSSRSAASSTRPTSTAQPGPPGLMYSQPSFGGSRGGSILSGPPAPYQSLRP